MSIRLYDSGSSTVLILPLLAMHDEYRCRAKQYNLSCETWMGNSNPATAPQLLLVAVENCSWPSLQAHIMTLVCLGHLSRIVVDEAHLLPKHKSFRPCMGMLAFFGTLPISIVLMTATCPCTLETQLFDKLGQAVYHVLRHSTDRPEISQNMVQIQADSGNIEEAVGQNIISVEQSAKDFERALLFCRNSCDECDHMAELLGWRPYHSSVPPEECAEAMKLWMDGGVFGLACTSMLNCCLNYPNVCYVFLRETLWITIK